eukprot:CAMPEP_0203902120 /NCGR_PEP_ID=MMETSP0359-20131031/44193_1 /ASSEMBLY_ACC=CAM_ASM_000338 /TAXON_ID=268821 /ORGANISM="Scrippsiella Hangoei, Strain SHTV-5" /LENGTH=407 /DNA_ID=CAMNT_0050825891 /DNA_START=9 /DNA_END=1229 /DNA_ORIENTATION=+
MATCTESDGSSSHGKEAVFGTLLSSYRAQSGTISPPPLERTLGTTALRGDLRSSPESLAQVREHLQTKGFTAAPGAAELVRMIKEVPFEQLRTTGTAFRNCIGLSHDQLSDAQRSSLCPYISKLVLASMAQLELLLPADCVVLGPLEGTYRGQLGAISWLHLDENRTSAAYLQQVLFPLPRSELEQESMCTRDDVFQRYNELTARLKTFYPDLSLPVASEWTGGKSSAEDNAAPDKDLQDFTLSVLEAISDYHETRGCLEEDELVLDFVNVWIPKAEKQLALLPLAHYARFRKETRPCVEEVEGFKHEFQAFGTGTPVIFYGRFVLHQAAEGQEFVKCTHGSMETRYLILTRRSSTHRLALRRPSCISQSAETSEDFVQEVDVTGPSTAAVTEATSSADATILPGGD